MVPKIEPPQELTDSAHRSVFMKNETDPDAAFDLEGPDERGDVWVSGHEGRQPWRRNLGPADTVADKFITWLKNRWLRIGKAGALKKPRSPRG